MAGSISLKDSMGQSILQAAPPKVARASKLKEAWETIATEAVLEHTDNVADSNKKANSLLIYVDDAQWCAQLSMNKEYYRQSFHYVLNEEISDVFFYVSKKTGIRKKFEKRYDRKPWYIDDTKPVALSESELEYLRKSVASIEDEKLKETLFKAAVTDLEWKKGLKGAK